MADLARRFGSRLRSARNRRGLTQGQLADQASLSEEWVRKIERGEASPSFDTIEALCTALGLEPVELFEPKAPSPELDQLMDEARRLSPEELRWLLGLIEHLRRRPAS